MCSGLWKVLPGLLRGGALHIPLVMLTVKTEFLMVMVGNEELKPLAFLT